MDNTAAPAANNQTVDAPRLEVANAPGSETVDMPSTQSASAFASIVDEVSQDTLFGSLAATQPAAEEATPSAEERDWRIRSQINHLRWARSVSTLICTINLPSSTKTRLTHNLLLFCQVPSSPEEGED